jgi:hypothetical protein
VTTLSQQVRAQGFGSVEEFLVYQELLRRGLKDGLDFTFQSAQFGGRLDRGGLVVDFLFSNPPGLAINPLGAYWHGTPEARARDLLSRALLAGQGVTLIWIDDDDVNRDVQYYVGEALGFRDHSRLARGVM